MSLGLPLRTSKVVCMGCRGTRGVKGGAPSPGSGALPPGPEIRSRFRAGAGLQLAVRRRVDAGARQVRLTRRYTRASVSASQAEGRRFEAGLALQLSCCSQAFTGSGDFSRSASVSSGDAGRLPRIGRINRVSRHVRVGIFRRADSRLRFQRRATAPTPRSASRAGLSPAEIRWLE